MPRQQKLGYLSLAAAKAIESQLKDRIAKIAPQERTALLRKMLADKRFRWSEEIAVERAFVAFVAVRGHHYADPTSIELSLKRAKVVFSELAIHNRRFAAYVREAAFVLGLLQMNLESYDKAADAFHDAIKGEKDTYRRAIALLNTARARLASGRFRLSIGALDRIARITKVPPRIEAFTLLVRARILVTLGFYGAARALLCRNASIEAGGNQAQVERFYLLAMIDLSTGSLDQIEVVTDLFRSQLRAIAATESVHRYYSFEMSIFRAIARTPRMIEATETKGDGDVKLFARLATATQRFFGSSVREGRPFRPVFNALAKLELAPHQIVYAAAALCLAKQLTSARHVKKASDLCLQLSDFIASLRGAMPKATLLALTAHGETIDEAISGLTARDREDEVAQNWAARLVDDA